MTDDALIEAARSALARSYSPYSHFRVGAAILDQAGKVTTGTNIENASFGLTICAERAAIAAARMGGMEHIQAVAIVTDAGDPVAPCGACRQVLHEFGDPRVILEGTTGRRTSHRLSELLPLAFGPSDLPGAGA